MTTFLHILTVCAALGGDPYTCVSYAVENRALCETAMQITYEDLHPEVGKRLYIGCEQTNTLTHTIRPEARP